MRECPTCGHHTPDGHFCVRCGAPLDTTLDHSHQRAQFAAAPGQGRHVPHLISTLFPQLPHHSERHFRIALALGAIAVIALGAFRLFGVALIVAALLMPLITLLYFYDVDIYGEHPRVGIAWTVGWGAVAGGGLGLLTQALAPTGAALVDRSSNGQVLVGGLLIPALGVLLMLAGPLVLLPYRRYDEVLEGASFGGASAATFAAAEVIVVGAGVLSGGLRPPGAILPWAERLLTLAVATPVLAMSTVGFAAAALWLRYRAPQGDRRALGRLGSAPVAIGLALVLVLAGAVAETFLPVGVWLIWLVILDVAGVLLLRRALHVGLLEAAGEQAIGPEIRCANCGAMTAGHTFCGNCGIALRALPATRAQPTGTGPGRLTAGKRDLLRVGAAGAVLVVGAAVALVVAVIATPAARAPRCQRGAVCGKPPPPAPKPPVTAAYAYWRSPALGYTVRYVTGQWSIAAQSGDHLQLQSSDGISQITLQGAAAPPSSPGVLLAATRSTLQGQLLGLSADTNAADRILGPNVGLVAGVGSVYRATTNLPQAPDAPVSIALLASRAGRAAIVATVVTPANSPGEQSTIFTEADDILNSIQFPGP